MTEATLDDGTRRRTEALRAARQRDSHTKRAHVRSTIEKMLLAGEVASRIRCKSACGGSGFGE